MAAAMAVSTSGSGPFGPNLFAFRVYRSTSLIRNRIPPRTAMGPYAYAYCRVLGGGIWPFGPNLFAFVV
jgi:hypothetical protein